MVFPPFRCFALSLSFGLILLWGIAFIAWAQSEGAHLELHSTNLKVTSLDPFTVEGDIVFENQGGAALTIRQLQSGTAGSVEVRKTSKFLWFLNLERPVNTIRVNAQSTRELTRENGYTVRFTDYPSDYGNPGIFSLYVDLGPANDPRWDDRGQLMILRYNKRITPPD